MTIQTVIQEVLASDRLTRKQQEIINTLLWQGRYTEADIQALDQLTDAVLSNRVQVETPNIQTHRAA